MIKSYCFHAKAPTTQLESVSEQMLLAHRYRNKLVELERTRRQECEQLIRKLSPEYAELANQYDAANKTVDEAYAILKAERAKARTRLEPTTAQLKTINDAKLVRQQAAKNAKSAKQATYATLKELQKPYWEAAVQKVTESQDPNDPLKESALKKLIRAEAMDKLHQAGLDAGEYNYESSQKLARHQCGCYGGTYLSVEVAAKDFHTGTSPVFKSWNGDGTISVQLAGGLSSEDAYAGNSTMLRIQLSNLEELQTRGKSTGQRAIGSIMIRIGSDGREPIWATVPVLFHRLLPAGSEIRWAYLYRRRFGRKDKWSLRLVVREPDPVQDPLHVALPHVALHMGYRITDDGLRVAVWKGSDGAGGSIIIDNDWIEEDDEVDRVQAYRDTKLNEFKSKLLEWFVGQTLPEWLVNATTAIDKWRSLDRFVNLCALWSNNRFVGDEDIFSAFTTWCEWDTRKLQHQDRLRSRLIGRKVDLYRCTLKKLAERYSKVVIAKVDLKKLTKREVDDAPITQTPRQRHNARLASPGLLSRLAGEYFDVVLVNARNVTVKCYKCGHVNSHMDHNVRIQVCAGCGTNWDQDINAVLNTLHCDESVVAQPTTEPVRRHRNRRANQLTQRNET